jgi:ribosomal protein L3
MIKGILGKKLGMSQLFKEDGEVVPITLIQTGPCYVMQKKTLERDGYEAVQLGLGPRKVSRINKPEKNHQDKAGKGYFYHLKEVACDDVSAVNEGDEVKVSDITLQATRRRTVRLSIARLVPSVRPPTQARLPRVSGCPATWVPGR